jgi:flagellar biosynthesis protein FlhF
VKIRKYMVESIKDAIEKIREELGPDAVILHSRRVSESGSATGRGMFEVTAAIEDGTAGEPGPAAVDSPRPIGQTVGEAFRNVPEIAERDDRGSVDFLISDDDAEGPVSHRPAPMKRVAGTGARGRPGKPGVLPEISMKLSEVHESMLSNDVDELVAESLVKTALEESRIVGDASVLDDCLPRSVERFVRCSGPIVAGGDRAKVVALVGPTGVGKTTTVSKLATNFVVLEGRSVALVTVDVQRSCAVQQLKIYADMLQAPFEVALNPVELRRAIRRHEDKDVILIDTGGRNPYKWISILELASFFKGIEDLEIHLVLSAATSSKENLSAVERFGALALSRILFTKIDETVDHGAIVNVASACRKPISYLTTGQSIPDDIEVAEYGRIVELISKPKDGKL